MKKRLLRLSGFSAIALCGLSTPSKDGSVVKRISVKFYEVVR